VRYLVQHPCIAFDHLKKNKIIFNEKDWFGLLFGLVTIRDTGICKIGLRFIKLDKNKAQHIQIK
jgi:hypothetical protein